MDQCITTSEKHYVTFYSPGTLMSETTTEPIRAWNRELAVAMSKTIVERYGARPFAFRFLTRLEAEPVRTDRGTMTVEPKETARSGLHFLGGTILTLSDVETRADPRDAILISNMRCNKIERVVENTNSWKSVTPFAPGDVVVDSNGAIVAEASR